MGMIFKIEVDPYIFTLLQTYESHLTVLHVQTKKLTIGQKLTVVCKVGYMLTSPSSLTCLASGSLDPANLTCEPVSCGEPVASRHATLSNSTYKYGESFIILKRLTARAGFSSCEALG